MNTIRRIAYVAKMFPKVSETFIANELAEVLRRGIEVRVLSLLPATEELRHGIVSRAGLESRVCYDADRFRAQLAEFRPQLLHAHFATDATAAARELSAELGIPYCFTAHGYDVYRKPPADFGARARQAAALVTVSEANRTHIAERFGVPRERVHVVPCGVDTEFFSPGAERLDPPHIVCVARLVPVKNHLLLLEACARLRARGVAFRCVLVGEGRLRADIEAARSRLGLEDCVVLAGAAEQDQVRAWLRGAHVAVLSSTSEGMPVSLMEAAACGVPVVATAVGGVPELMEEGETGFVVPSGDAEALADRLQRLLGEPELRARMGRRARARALERFSVVGQVDRLTAIWQRAIAREGGMSREQGGAEALRLGTCAADAPHCAGSAVQLRRHGRFAGAPLGMRPAAIAAGRRRRSAKRNGDVTEAAA
ncbi:MAG: glycosyltransferase [Betaproteobacteria bacterium]|nr:glycosyltransferase [Betaproteobacteria bacterium]